jgi:hypothetical protein
VPADIVERREERLLLKAPLFERDSVGIVLHLPFTNKLSSKLETPIIYLSVSV